MSESHSGQSKYHTACRVSSLLDRRRSPAIPTGRRRQRGSHFHEADIERTVSHPDDKGKADQPRYEKIDHELAKYEGTEVIHITPEENIRLRKLVDKRMPVIMISTSFLLATDKETLSISAYHGPTKRYRTYSAQRSAWISIALADDLNLSWYPCR